MSEPPTSGWGIWVSDSPYDEPEPDAESEHIEYEFDIDVGDVAPGHRLFARGICLFDDQLSLKYAWVPGLTHDYGEGPVDIWPNVWYDADVSPPNQNMIGSYGPCDGGPVTEGDFQYSCPGPGARYAFFDFFEPNFDVDGNLDGDGHPDVEYLANRVSRLTVDLQTGHAELSA